MKRFEDLEFQQLEKESSHPEEKVTRFQQILKEIAEYQHILVTRKVCVCVYGRYVVCVHQQNRFHWQEIKNIVLV